MPFIVGTNAHIERVYNLYWEAFEQFRSVPVITNLEENEHFCQLVRRLLKSHLVVIPQLAWGMAESHQFMSMPEVDRFMIETIKSRIGRRVLAEQHLALSESWEAHQSDHDLGRWIGILDTACTASKTVKKCAAKATSFVRESTGLEPPEVIINGRVQAEFLYIPDHIEYVLYELIKNSMQATIKRHSDGSGDPPPIVVTIGEWQSSIMFRVSDQGGGIEKSIRDSVFSIALGAERNLSNFGHMPQLAAKMNERVPISLGLSMAMSKIYANYWGGDIHLTTMDGFGTDVYVSLSVGNQTENLKAPQDPSELLK